MRMLFTFIGGIGHFHPLVPVIRAVEEAGHDVAVACGGGVVPQVRGAGLRAFATSTARPRQTMPTPRRPGPTPATDRAAAELEFAQNFADKGARRHAVAVREVIETWHPDVVIRDEADLGTAIAAELLGTPSATVLVLAAGLLVRPDLVGPPLAALRAEHGLPPDPGLDMLTRGQLLAPFPSSFRSPASPLPIPPTTLWFRPDAPRADPARRRPSGRSSVYATLGTVFNQESGDLFERMLAGLADLDADVLLTVGRAVDPDDLGRQPDHVRVERFVPQAEVLPTVDLVVSHGGSGSLMAALAHGLPSVLLPLGADQPHNAERAAHLGLARVLDAASVTPEEIRTAVEEGLGDREARRRAEAMAQEFGTLPGVDAVVAALERLVSAQIV